LHIRGFFVEIHDYSTKKNLKIKKTFCYTKIHENYTDKFFYKKVSLDKVMLKLIVTGDSMTIQT